MFKKYFKNIVLISCLLNFSYAGTIRSQGTAGASQLLIPVGAENIALGGSNIATVSGVDALYINPAGTSGLTSGAQISVSNMTYLADIDVTYAGIATSLGDFGNVGLSVKSLDFGEIAVTTATETEGTGAFYSPSFITATANYSKSFADNVRFGTNVKFVTEKIMNTGASGLALDLGVQYEFNELPLGIGVSLKNLGGRMSYDGSDLEQNHVPEESESGSLNERFRITAQSFELPAQLDIGLSLNAIENLSVLASYTNNSFSSNVIGLSGKYTLGTLWVAGGFSSVSPIGNEDDFTEENWDNMTESIYGGNFGLGASVAVGELMLDIGYSVRMVTNYFENNNVLELSLNF